VRAGRERGRSAWARARRGVARSRQTGRSAAQVVGRLLLAALGTPLVAERCPGQDFADRLLAFVPAPGQFVNQAVYSDPVRALGAPIGGGVLAPDNTKLVSLGGFGGSITLGFSKRVLDDPCNPMGMDAIAFGNALWAAGDPNRRSCEPAVIEISLDSNGNGLADDAWFLIPGSLLSPPVTLRCQAWDSNSGTPTPPTNPNWYPPGAPPAFSTCAYELPPELAAVVVENPLGLESECEVYSGYADFTPTLLLGDTDADGEVDDEDLGPDVFYTTPDSPYLVGITPGSGGGDAFDVGWAIDPTTWLPAGLPGFDFIRISTGLDAIRGPLGEISAEIGAVARVRARPACFDLNGDASVDVEDLYKWEILRAEGGETADLNQDGSVSSEDRRLQVRCVRRIEVSDMRE